MKSFLGECKYIRMVWVALIIFSIPSIPSIPENASAESVAKSALSPENLTTVIVDNYFPYTFANKNGEPDGFSVDLMKAVARVMGMALVTKVDTWEHAKNALGEGEIDFLPMMAYSKERDSLFDFSVPHTIAYDAFFIRKNTRSISTINDLKGKTVIVMKDDQAHEFLRSTGLIDADNLLFISSIPEALRLLSSGAGDAALMPKLVGLIVLKDLALTNLDHSPVVVEAYNRPFSFAVKEGNQPLLERLNQGLTILKKTNQYSEIYEKWFGAIEPKALAFGAVFKYILMIFLALVLIGLALTLWSISLRKQVAMRTRNLEDEILVRKQTEEALRDSERLLNEVGRIAKIGGWEMDLVTRKAKWTQGTYDIVEIEHNRPIPGPDEHVEYYLPEYRSLVSKSMQALVEDDKPLDFEAQARTAKGAIIWCRALGRSIKKEGRCIKVYGTFQDITDRKKAEEEIRKLNRDLELCVKMRTAQLEEANKELEDFVYSVSHDLRAPLRSISGFAQIIDRRHKNSLNEEGRHYFDNIIKASSQMGNLIDDLLKLSRLGRKSIKSGNVSLDDVLEAALETLSAQIQKTGARINLPEQMPVIQGDFTLATHIFINLLENAVKYHKPDESPRIDIGFEVKDQYVMVSVADNGIGIASEYHEKIFNIFQRLHSEADYPGTGIGLAAVKKALQMMGGEVTVISEPGKGSIFTVKLPAGEGQ